MDSTSFPQALRDAFSGGSYPNIADEIAMAIQRQIPDIGGLSAFEWKEVFKRSTFDNISDQLAEAFTVQENLNYRNKLRDEVAAKFLHAVLNDPHIEIDPTNFDETLMDQCFQLADKFITRSCVK